MGKVAEGTGDRLFDDHLAGLSMLGYLAMDMYLPAFGALRSELGLSAGAVGASLSIFLAGFAFGQLLWGPLSDRLGRKPVLLAGLSMFALGCVGMLFVDNAALLLTLRFIQAIGICAAAVTWQALVLDRYPAASANNGSAFAGLNANTPFYNLMLGLGMLIGRFGYILPVLALAGCMTRRPPTIDAGSAWG